MNKEELILKLNDADVNVRLDSLKQLMAMIKAGEIEAPKQGNDVNNHIHTTFSFSPYSPTKAAYMAYKAGLTSAGIMDHDSLSGAIEFKKACEILKMGAGAQWDKELVRQFIIIAPSLATNI